MHLLVPIVLLLPLVLECLMFGLAPAFAVSLAWVPLRSARRTVVLGERGGAYRTPPARVLDRVPLPEETFVTSTNDRVHIDARRRLAWVRLRTARLTLIRIRVIDDEESFTLSAAALPVPALGFLIGCALASVLLADLTGPSAFALPLFALVFGGLAAWASFAQASGTVERIADALVAHVVAAQDEQQRRFEQASASSPGHSSEDEVESDGGRRRGL